MIFDWIRGPRKTSTKVIFKFILFSAGVLFLWLVFLQGWYIHQGIHQKEMILSKRLTRPFNPNIRHQKDGCVIPQQEKCFSLYGEKFCLSDAKRVYFFQHIYHIDDIYFLIKPERGQIAIQDITDLVEHVEYIFISSFWVFFLYLLVAYPLGVLFLKTIYQKLYQASKHLEHDEMIDIPSMHLAPHDEIRLLFEKINTAMESIKQFNSYVSHEIKTPLMMAYSHLDLMKVQIENKSYDKLKIKIPQIQKNLNDVAEIVDVLGKFILIENKSYTPEKKEIDLERVLSEQIKYYGTLKTIDFKTDATGKIVTNPILFSLLLRNLIDNAVKYSIVESWKKQAKIFVTLNPTELRIKNTAKKPENLEALSEKFYKEGSESGLGLGLYLVKKIVGLLGWSMFIEYDEEMFEVRVEMNYTWK